MNRKLLKKLNNLVVVLCGLVLFIIYFIDIKNDIYYFFSQQESTATVENIEKTNKSTPYKITLKYFNNNTFQHEKCSLFLNKKKGAEMIETDIKNIKITYTKQRPCDIYIANYKTPTAGMLVIRGVIITIIGWGVIIFFLKILKKED